jgi:hypothetical protein
VLEIWQQLELHLQDLACSFQTNNRNTLAERKFASFQIDDSWHYMYIKIVISYPLIRKIIMTH